jgi:peptidoglycan/LPS O-acetylase OafA/YrhL
MWSGVDLFFVLSGLLIGGILLDHKESQSYYSTFYARRVHRIFPLYYLMVAGLIVGISILPQLPLFHGAIPWWTYPLFAQNLTGQPFSQASPWLGVSWSLAVEEQFYLLLPLAVRFCSRKTLIWLIATCIFGAPLLRAILIMLGATHDQIHALLPCRADALALGVAAALILRSETAIAWVRRNTKFLYVSMLLLYVSLPALMKWNSFTYLNAVAFTFFDIMYFLLILLLLIAPIPPLKAFFSFPVLRWLGAISYCVYLIHSPIQQGLFLALRLGSDTTITGATTLLANLAAIAITLLIAQVSWLALEKPLIQRAHLRYSYK